LASSAARLADERDFLREQTQQIKERQNYGVTLEEIAKLKFKYSFRDLTEREKKEFVSLVDLWKLRRALTGSMTILGFIYTVSTVTIYWSILTHSVPIFLPVSLGLLGIAGIVGFWKFWDKSSSLERYLISLEAAYSGIRVAEEKYMIWLEDYMKWRTRWNERRAQNIILGEEDLKGMRELSAHRAWISMMLPAFFSPPSADEYIAQRRKTFKQLFDVSDQLDFAGVLTENLQNTLVQWKEGYHSLWEGVAGIEIEDAYAPLTPFDSRPMILSLVHSLKQPIDAEKQHLEQSDFSAETQRKGPAILDRSFRQAKRRLRELKLVETRGQMHDGVREIVIQLYGGIARKYLPAIFTHEIEIHLRQLDAAAAEFLAARLADGGLFVLSKVFPGSFDILKYFLDQASSDIFAFVEGDNGRSSIGMAEINVTTFLTDFFKTKLLENSNDFKRLKRGETAQSAGYSDFLKTDELERFGRFFLNFKAEMDRRLNALQELRHRFGLGMAAFQSGNGTHQNPILVLFNQHNIFDLFHKLTSGSKGNIGPQRSQVAAPARRRFDGGERYRAARLASRRIRERKVFFRLLEQANRLHLLLEEKGFQDKSVFEFNVDFPNKAAVMSWGDDKLLSKKRILRDIIEHRSRIGKFDKLPLEDVAKLLRLADLSGIIDKRRKAPGLEEELKAILKSEGRYHRKGVAYDENTGLTLDFYDLKKKEARNLSAPSKESLHLAILALAVLGNEKARIFISPDEPEKAPALAISLLERKIKSYNRFAQDLQYKAYGGFVPWFVPTPDGLEPASDWQPHGVSGSSALRSRTAPGSIASS